MTTPTPHRCDNCDGIDPSSCINAPGNRTPTGDKAEQCGTSSRIRFGRSVPFIGPCVLRHGHDGPVHEDADGAQWTDPRPAKAGDLAALCPPAGGLRERLAEALYRRLREQVGSDAGAQIRAEAKADDLVDAVLPVVETKTAALRNLLGDIWLYVDWRYVTRQLTTEQKELWADAIETTADPEVELTVDRWWRE